jgi:long-subunit acyl-CoA synthetase (AMP-forming)
MQPKTKEFFAKINLPVSGLYGLSETAAAATL